MQAQLNKFNERKQKKLETDLKTNAALNGRDRKLKKKQGKFIRMKREIEELWSMLEH